MLQSSIAVNISLPYLFLFHAGILAERAKCLAERLTSCNICPRACGVNRMRGELGFCRSGALPIISSYCTHHGEEPALSGTYGSGAIFFGNCNLRCVFCQNHQISQDPASQKANEADTRKLAETMLALQTKGCHNINLVSPSHFTPQIVQALLLAIPLGLSIPLVYNTNAYDSLDTLRELNGIIDIYLPDLKYASNKNAEKYSQAPNYTQVSRAAIKEMFYQVGELRTDEDGLAERGLIVRHLILPDDAAGTNESLQWLAREVSPNITVSLMSQYHPSHHAARFPELARSITASEYTAAEQSLAEAEIENGWVQDLAAPDNYLPDFTRPGHPFENT